MSIFGNLFDDDTEEMLTHMRAAQQAQERYILDTQRQIRLEQAERQAAMTRVSGIHYYQGAMPPQYIQPREQDPAEAFQYQLSKFIDDCRLIGFDIKGICLAEVANKKLRASIPTKLTDDLDRLSFRGVQIHGEAPPMTELDLKKYMETVD